MINDLPTTVKKEGLTVAEQLILEGRELEKVASIFKMLEDGTISDAQIANFTNSTLNYVDEIKKRWLQSKKK